MSELQQLRDRVAELEELLGDADSDLFARLGLTPPQRKMIGLLMKRPLVSKDAAFIALYGGRPEASQPEIKILDVHVSFVRVTLRKIGVAIGTQWGVGWYMTPENKAKLRGYLEGPQ